MNKENNIIFLIKRRYKFLLLSLLIIILFLSVPFSFIYKSNNDNKHISIYSKIDSIFTFQDSCSSVEIHLKKYDEKDFQLIATTQRITGNYISTWHLPYSVFKIDIADIDMNGKIDICIGVIKKTRYDPYHKKRLFLFQLIDGNIRALWLGSRLSKPLVTFKVVNKDGINIIRTIEEEENSNYLVAEYKWYSFGLQFISYLGRNIPDKDILKIYNKS